MPADLPCFGTVTVGGERMWRRAYVIVFNA